MSASSPTLPSPTAAQRWRGRLPGVALTGGVAAAAMGLATLPWLRGHGISALTLAIVLGIALGNTLYPRLAPHAAAGVGVSKQWLLRAGIVLYGLRLTFQDIGQVGVAGVLIDALVLSSTFALAWWAGTRWFGMDRDGALLIGAGSAICGAAAVMAAEPVVRGRAEQVTVAVSTVVVFGTLGMFLYPALFQLNLAHAWVPMSEQLYGVFTGSTVHEVAQVVAAGRAVSEGAADTAVIAKMVRVMMLAPFLVALSLLMARGRAARPEQPRAKIVVPWFAFGFVAVAAINSLHLLPHAVVETAIDLDTVLLAMAMAALGLTTHVSALRQAGMKPLLLALLLFAWLIGGGLAINLGVHGLIGQARPTVVPCRNGPTAGHAVGPGGGANAAQRVECGMNEFSELPLSASLAAGIDALGYTQMTPVQAQALPAILARRDLIAQAPTGSGKTAAFGLGLLQALDPSVIRAQALVLCPTRELADQVGKQIRKLATGIPNLKLVVLTGGMPLGPQLASLEAHDPHVVVGTPGRIQELGRKRVLKLGGVTTLVLDEADRMLDMGFEEPIREIAGRTSKDRQTLLFSATYPDEIREIARVLLRDPVEVTVEGVDHAPAIRHLFCEVDLASKQKALAGLLLKYNPESTVVFCNTRRDVDDVAVSLQQFGFSALPLHGEMEQRDRDEVLVRFANRSCNVLVASDVAARGLDVQDLAAVINYELPTDIETYEHRVGRTGRAGATGLAISLVTGRERNRADALEAAQGKPLDWQKTPLATARPAVLPQAAMETLRIDGGKTDKLRPGDILGALTGDAGLSAKVIGKIDIYATRSYVAIAREHVGKAIARLEAGKIKGRRFRVRQM